MNNKMHTILAIMLLVGLLLMCMAGCQGNPSNQPTEATQTTDAGASMTVVGGQERDSALQEGNFAKPGQMDQITSNAKELGGSKTLEIEFPEEETYPEQGDTNATEPQWQPGIW